MPKHTSACNNLDLIRLVAATLVIFSHAYLVTAQFDQEPLHGEP